MVKVQNGWESHSIDELERLSQQSSPVSATPRLPLVDDGSRPHHRPENITLTRTAHNANPAPDFAHVTTSNRGGLTSERETLQTNSPVPSPRSALISRTYESFWREHSMNNAPSKHVQTPVQPSPAPSLGPPADILPRSRPGTGLLDSTRFPPPAKTPKLDSPIRNEQATSSGDGSSSTPATPARHKPTMRTASQNAAMEKDAVETLLFMSSPGNSGHHPPLTRPLDTPPSSSSQNTFFPRPSAKQVGFATDLRGDASSSHQHPPHNIRSTVSTTQPYFCEKGLLKPGQKLTGADVDRYLDQMPDEDSSSSSSDDDDDDDPRVLYRRNRSSQSFVHG